MDFKKLYPMLRACQESKTSVLVESKPGVGKSTLFKDYSKTYNYHFEHLFAPQFESAGDVLGIPYKLTDEQTGEEIMKFTRPDWLNRMWIAHLNGKLCVLLVDEFNRANEDIRQMGLAWFLDHRINGHEFPPNTLVATAINPDDEDYSVNFLDRAQIGRFVKIKLEVDHESWVGWAKDNNIHSSVLGFIINNPAYLHNEIPGQDMNSDPRAWELLSRSLQKLEKEIDDNNLGRETLNYCAYLLSIGKVGSNAGVKFMDYYKSNTSMELQDVISFINNSKIDKVILKDKKFIGKQKEVIESKNYSELNEYKKDIFQKISQVGKSLSQEYDNKNVQSIKVGVFAKDLINSHVSKIDMYGKEVEKLKSQKLEDNLNLITFLYSLTPEILASTFKEIKERSPHLAVDIGNLDYNRQLTSSILERKDRNLKEIE